PRKREALFAHSSQIQESWFSKIPADIAENAFGTESFIRASDTTGAPLPEDDLFAGLRAPASYARPEQPLVSSGAAGKAGNPDGARGLGRATGPAAHDRMTRAVPVSRDVPRLVSLLAFPPAGAWLAAARPAGDEWDPAPRPRPILLGRAAALSTKPLPGLPRSAIPRR